MQYKPTHIVKYFYAFDLYHKANQYEYEHD